MNVLVRDGMGEEVLLELNLTPALLRSLLNQDFAEGNINAFPN